MIAALSGRRLSNLAEDLALRVGGRETHGEFPFTAAVQPARRAKSFVISAGLQPHSRRYQGLPGRVEEQGTRAWCNPLTERLASNLRPGAMENHSSQGSGYPGRRSLVLLLGVGGRLGGEIAEEA